MNIVTSKLSQKNILMKTGFFELPFRCRVFIIGISIVALGFFVISISNFFYPSYSIITTNEIVFWALLVIFSESFLIYLPFSGYLSIGTAIDISIILIWGPVLSSCYGALGAVSSLIVRRAPAYKVFFNIALFILTMGVSSWVYHSLADGINLIKSPYLIAVFFLTIAVYFLINSGLLSIAIGLSEGISPKVIWIKNHSWTISYLFVLSAIGYLMVMVNFTLGKWAVVLLLFPVLLIRKAYGQYMDLKKMQAQLIQSERLAAVGQMAAGISHEIDNPMSVILGYSDYLLKKLPNNDPLREEIAIIKKEAERCKVTIRQYLDFSRPKAQVGIVNINTVLSNALTLLKHESISRNVELIFNENKDVPNVIGDAKQLEQVCVNIILNAYQAMPNGGQLEISTSLQENPKGKEKSFFSRIWRGEGRDRVVCIKFKDTGRGISEDDMKRLFMPFFTTRSEEGGRGLGLYVSHRILEEQGGSVEIESKLQKGTLVTIYIPCSLEH